jgi:hypothetical protein
LSSGISLTLIELFYEGIHGVIIIFHLSPRSIQPSPSAQILTLWHEKDIMVICYKIAALKIKVKQRTPQQAAGHVRAVYNQSKSSRFICL